MALFHQLEAGAGAAGAGAGAGSRAGAGLEPVQSWFCLGTFQELVCFSTHAEPLPSHIMTSLRLIQPPFDVL